MRPDAASPAASVTSLARPSDLLPRMGLEERDKVGGDQDRAGGRGHGLQEAMAHGGRVKTRLNIKLSVGTNERCFLLLVLLDSDEFRSPSSLALLHTLPNVPERRT